MTEVVAEQTEAPVTETPVVEIPESFDKGISAQPESMRGLFDSHVDGLKSARGGERARGGADAQGSNNRPHGYGRRARPVANCGYGRASPVATGHVLDDRARIRPDSVRVVRLRCISGPE